MSLDLTPGHGNLLGEYEWEILSPWLSESWTLNTGVSPREGRACSLSQILEDSFTMRICSINRPDLAPARPERGPATLRSWHGPPPQMIPAPGVLAERAGGAGPAPRPRNGRAIAGQKVGRGAHHAAAPGIAVVLILELVLKGIKPGPQVMDADLEEILYRPPDELCWEDEPEPFTGPAMDTVY